MKSVQRRKTAALTAATAATVEVAAAQRRLEVAVGRAAHWGATWAEIANALGVTPQGAHKRFRNIRYDPSTGRAWTEPQLPL